MSLFMGLVDMGKVRTKEALRLGRLEYRGGA
jgi:hypothetical protein